MLVKNLIKLSNILSQRLVLEEHAFIWPKQQNKSLRAKMVIMHNLVNIKLTIKIET